MAAGDLNYSDYVTQAELEEEIASISRQSVYRNPTFRIVGDSIASQNDTISKTEVGSTTAYIARAPRWWSFTQWLTGSNFNYISSYDTKTEKRVGSNSGIGSDDFTETLTNIQNNIAYWPETNVIVVCGTNSLNGGASLATMKSGILAITTAIENAGKVPIFTTVTPRNAVDGASDWSATGTTAAQKRLILVAYNQWLIDYAKENGYRVIDFYSVLANASGDAITGYTLDSVHPSPRGSYYLALKVIEEIGDLLPEARKGELYAANAYDATYNPGGNILNGALTGTGGNIGTGATGSLPDNFQIVRSSGTSTVVASIVDASVETALADRGLKGNAVKLVFTIASGGSSGRSFRFNSYISATTSISGFAVLGDLITMSADILVMEGHGGLIGLSTQVAISSAITTGNVTDVSFDAATRTINSVADRFGSFLANRKVVVAGSTSNNLVFDVDQVVSAKQLKVSGATVTNEAAGATLSVRHVPWTASTGFSTDKLADETMLLHQETPVLRPFTSNMVPRVEFFLDESGAGGTATVYIMNPNLRKLQVTPALLEVVADDNF